MVPFVAAGEGMFSDLDIYSLKEGDEEEIHKQPVPDVVMEIPFADMFDIAGKSDKVVGVVINPFGRYFKADKKVIECIYEVFKNMED